MLMSSVCLHTSPRFMPSERYYVDITCKPRISRRGERDEWDTLSALHGFVKVLKRNPCHIHVN